MFCRLALFLLTTICPAQAAVVYGIIQSEDGQHLPYTTIYVRGTGIGTTSNEEGYYRLQLNSGRYELIFQHVGYQRQVQTLVMGSENVELNIIMIREAVELEELRITDAAEDPAYAIIRKAQEHRRYHRNQVGAYSCHVYIKGVQRLTEIPPRIMGVSTARQGLDSSLLGTVYQSESESQFFFQAPDRTKEIVYSSKMSGNNRGFTWNTATAFTSNFYDNLIALGGISPRGLVSPIAEGALLFYRYRLLGTFYEDGNLINKIEVIPRRSGDPVFRGVIYIVEGRWNIHSLDLTATRQAQLEFVDTLRFVETFKPVNDTAWMPATQLLQFNFSVLGVKGNGYFLGIFSRYDLKPAFPANFFEKELIRVKDDANKKDSTYWERFRPVPLTEAEQREYRRSDSLYRIRNTKSYMDSVDRLRHRPELQDLLLGYTYRNSFRRWNLTWSAPLLGLSFNAVEGWNLTLRGSFEKSHEDRTGWEAATALRYGFASQRPGINFRFALNDNPVHQQRWLLAAGVFPTQVNEAEPISEWVNALYSLLKQDHLIRLYEKRYVQFSHRREWLRGVVLQMTLAAADRRPLANHTEYSLFPSENRRYTSNNDYGIAGVDTFLRSTAWSAAVAADVTPGQKYIVRPKRRIAVDSKWPTLTLFYRHTLITRPYRQHFGMIQLSTDYSWSLGLAGKALAACAVGTFVIDQPAHIVDYRHFSGNQTLIGLNWSEGFQLLPYYAYSSDAWWAQGHYEHHWGGFFFNKLPFIKKTRIQEVTGLHVLTTDRTVYGELALGVENLFKVIRADYVMGFDRSGQRHQGIRIGLLLAAAVGND